VTKRIAVANTAGRYVEDRQDLCRLHVSVVATAKKKKKARKLLQLIGLPFRSH